MKELKTERKAGQSFFLTATKGMPANTALALFAGNSTAMRAGIEGVIEDIDFREVGGANTPKLTNDQIVTLGNEQYIAAKAGEMPQAVTIIFDNKITMTLGLLLQGQEKSTITFKGDAAATKVTDLDLASLGDKLIGKRFKCVKFYRDATNPIVRNNNGAERSYAANCYEFVETTA